MSSMEAVLKAKARADYIKRVCGPNTPILNMLDYCGSVPYETMRTEVGRAIEAMDTLRTLGWRYHWKLYHDHPGKQCCMAGAYTIMARAGASSNMVERLSVAAGHLPGVPKAHYKNWEFTKGLLKELWEL